MGNYFTPTSISMYMVLLILYVLHNIAKWTWGSYFCLHCPALVFLLYGVIWEVIVSLTFVSQFAGTFTLWKPILCSTSHMREFVPVVLVLWKSSLIVRPFLPPVFDYLQYAKMKGKGLGDSGHRRGGVWQRILRCFIIKWLSNYWSLESFEENVITAWYGYTLD